MALADRAGGRDRDRPAPGWTERRFHLTGALAAIAASVIERGWLVRAGRRHLQLSTADTEQLCRQVWMLTPSQ
ncbi:MAG: hypothetical protein M3063_15310 [Actinomycetota bacterium]|nr:hypothetical protein [Actinomycetota bacterium]